MLWSLQQYDTFRRGNLVHDCIHICLRINTCKHMRIDSCTLLIDFVCTNQGAAFALRNMIKQIQYENFWIVELYLRKNIANISLKRRFPITKANHFWNRCVFVIYSNFKRNTLGANILTKCNFHRWQSWNSLVKTWAVDSSFDRDCEQL